MLSKEQMRSTGSLATELTVCAMPSKREASMSQGTSMGRASSRGPTDHRPPPEEKLKKNMVLPASLSP